ncbi:MAG: Hsp70 family protein [Deltaproteobacteria bacterium]|nr:Hsp70 family protein [Deltaproteobacteria bacterium]
MTSPSYNALPPEVETPSADLPKSDMIMGIDLGTTYSCVAIVEDDFPKVIPSRKGQRTTPSIVALDDKGRLLIGEEAKKQLLINPTNTIYGAKRFIGRHFYSDEVGALSRYFSYTVVPIGDMAVGAQVGDRIFSLPQVSAMILNELRKNVCEYLKKNISQAVVSVPAYYTENQREAVREAGRIAGIDVIRIINEPTAAALAYGLNKDYERKILVYDLGGGTFDASVLELFENVFKVLATGGDTFLGGVDFDERAVQYILSEYERAEGQILQCDSVITQRLKDAAERAKIELSSKSSAQIDLPYITIAQGKFKDFRAELSQEDFNAMTEDLVDRTIEVCVEVLDAAGMQPEDVESVILVGGQTRMPLVVDKVSRFFAKQPTKGVHPDEVVACGAALMAHSLVSQSSVRLIDVLPMSIGGRQPNGGFKTFFPANCSLPAEHEIGVATVHDGQQAIEVFLYQGESDQALENEFLGAFVVTGFPKSPKGQVRLAVNMSLDQESILEVTARTLSTGQPMHVQMVANAPAVAENLDLEPLEPVLAPVQAPVQAPVRPASPAAEKRRYSGLRGFIRRISE